MSNSGRWRDLIHWLHNLDPLEFDYGMVMNKIMEIKQKIAKEPQGSPLCTAIPMKSQEKEVCSHCSRIGACKYCGDVYGNFTPEVVNAKNVEELHNHLKEVCKQELDVTDYQDALATVMTERDRYSKALDSIIKHIDMISPTGTRFSTIYKIAKQALEDKER